MATVLQTLEEAPALLASQAEAMENARNAMEKAKHFLAVKKAEATLRYQESKNQEILKAQVTVDQNVIEAEDRLIAAETEYEIAKIKHEAIYNKFVSARKLAGITMDEMRALRGQVVMDKSLKEQ